MVTLMVLMLWCSVSDLKFLGSLNLAPGAERYHTALQNGGTAGASGINHSEMGVSVLDYSTDFPELPDKPNACASQLLGGVWNKPPAVRSERTTQVIFVSLVLVFTMIHVIFLSSYIPTSS